MPLAIVNRHPTIFPIGACIMLETRNLDTATANHQADGKKNLQTSWRADRDHQTSFLTYVLSLQDGDQLLECTLHYRVERWTEAYVVGDLLHSFTLLPGAETFITASSGTNFTRFTENRSPANLSLSRSGDRFWMDTFERLAQDFDAKEPFIGLFYMSGDTKGNGQQRNYGAGERIDGVNGKNSQANSSKLAPLSLGNILQSLCRHIRVTIKRTDRFVDDQAAVTISQVSSHGEAVLGLNDDLMISTRKFRNGNRHHALSLYFYPIAVRQRVVIQLAEKRLRMTNNCGQGIGSKSLTWINGSTPLYTAAGRYINESRLDSLLPDTEPIEETCLAPTDIVHVESKLQLIHNQ